MQYSLQIILLQGFCQLKIKITQFPGGFSLKLENGQFGACGDHTTDRYKAIQNWRAWL